MIRKFLHDVLSWVCYKCYATNPDSYNLCANCASPR